ncbi:hypothetical protein [Streptomyces montanus]|uniref:hypothetical protein n=1 Tax=Streptomyces montanus TaxID=2580423 RepID=UPI001FE7D0DC|nr:hypothetical protein [Streptomyces montanus]
MNADPPWTLLAELTHGCPLPCAYCSHPVELISRSKELNAEQGEDVLYQAADLGVVQTHLSVQHADPKKSERIAGARSYTAKEPAASLIRTAGLPFGADAVLHQRVRETVPRARELWIPAAPAPCAPPTSAASAARRTR